MSSGVSDYRARASRPLQRKSSLKRGSPIRRVSKTAQKAQGAQRRALRERSGGICEFDVFYTLSGEYNGWHRCFREAVDAAHIIPRRECGKARDLPDVVIHACRRDHDSFDDPLYPKNAKPRAPKELLTRARAAIVTANLKAPLKKSVRERLK